MATNGKRPNGHDHEPDPKVTSLEEARRRRDEQVRALKAQAGATGRSSGARGTGGSRTVRDLLVGGVLVLMALGMIASFVAPLFSAGGQ